MVINLTESELSTATKALTAHYLKLFHSKSRTSELAEVIQLFDKLRAASRTVPTNQGRAK